MGAVRVVSLPVLDRLRSSSARDELDRRIRDLEARSAPDGDEVLRHIERSVHEAVSLSEAVLVRRIEQLAGVVEELRAGLLANRRHTEEAVAAVHQAALAGAREHTEAAVEVSAQKLIRRIDTVRRAGALPPSPTALEGEPAPPQAAAGGQVVDPALYVALEDRFRGAPALIEDRQRAYLPHLEEVVDAEHPLLDLGSGRGEWLKILTEREIPARGVDSNPVSVDECREAGLEVVAGDLVAHLARQRPGSLGAVTMFQVVEHLPFPVLVSTLADIARVLRPGGVLIAETPNALNLRVAASTFWIDPTHQRPLHPELLEFLAQECGFASTERLFANRIGPASPDLSALPPPIADAVRRLIDDVDGPGDFALLARTPDTGNT